MRSSLLWKLWQMHQQQQQKEEVRNASAPNKARERWNNKGEINNGPTAGNGVGASSLEIRTGNLSMGYPVDFKSSGAKPNTAEGRLPCSVAVLSLTSLPDLWPLTLDLGEFRIQKGDGF